MSFCACSHSAFHPNSLWWKPIKHAKPSFTHCCLQCLHLLLQLSLVDHPQNAQQPNMQYFTMIMQFSLFYFKWDFSKSGPETGNLLVSFTILQMRSVTIDFLPTDQTCLVRFCLSSGRIGLIKESPSFTTQCTSKRSIFCHHRRYQMVNVLTHY